MVDLICMGYVELPGTGTKPELQSNKILLHTVGSEPQTFH